MGRTKVSWVAICATVAVVGLGVYYYQSNQPEARPAAGLKRQAQGITFGGAEESAKARQLESWHETGVGEYPTHAEYQAM